ncbi:MAG: DUF3108 domain-containing protein [Burkholderiales bacterium]|nr:DUF3108 domain-containing protein [Burkholderiales bacterium]
MTRIAERMRAAGATVALLAASVALHALVVAGMAGRLGTAAPRPADAGSTVEVALLAPPAPPTLSAAPAVAPAPAPKAPRRAAAPDAQPRAPAASRPDVTPAESVESSSEPTPVAQAAAQAAEPPPATEPLPAASEPPAAPVADAPVPPPAVEPAVPAMPAVPAVPLPALPGSRRQRFKVYWGDFSDGRSVARLEYRLSHDGARYELRTEGEAEGLLSLVYSGTLTQSSAGRLGPGGLQPVRYAETRGKRAERAVAFDPDGRRLLPGGGEPVPLPAGTQDRLSVFYQIGLLVRAEPARFVAGLAFELPVATMREVRSERFVVVGADVLMAPGGPIHALHLARPVRPGTDDPRIDLWLGYDFEMLPVRLRIEDAGRRVLDQVIDRDG